MNAPSAFEAALGQEIRAWRKRRNLTVVQLAERSGVSKATIERMENATHSMSVSNTWKVAEALDIDFSALVRRAEQALEIDQVPEEDWTKPRGEGIAASLDPGEPAKGVSDLSGRRASRRAPSRADRRYAVPVEEAAREERGKPRMGDE